MVLKQIARHMLPLNEWLNIDLLKLASRHCSGSLIVILFFSGVAWVGRHTMHEGYVLSYIELVDSIVIIGCITWLAAIMFWELAAIFKRVITSGRGTENSILLG